MMQQAKTLANNGELEAAAALFKEILSRFPENDEAREALDSVELARVGQNAFMEQNATQLISLYSSGQLEEGLKLGSSLVKRFPNIPLFHNILGAIHAGVGNGESAVASMRRAVALRPDYAEAHANLGSLLSGLGDHEGSIESLTSATKLKPDDKEAFYNLGNTYQQSGDLKNAVRAYERAIELDGGFDRAHHNLANVQHDLGLHHEAIRNYSKAIGVSPNYVDAYVGRSIVKRSLGMNIEATADLEKALELDPSHATALFLITTVKSLVPSDPLIQQMQTILDTKAGDVQDRIGLYFALGTVYEKAGLIDQSFENIRKGNLERKASSPFDPEREKAFFQSLKDQYSIVSETPPDAVDADDPSKIPILIIGMPRSGTTLTEQILASHSEVYGAGELNILDEKFSPLARGGELSDKASLANASRDYLDRLSEIGAAERYITDKMPLNFRWVGFLQSAVPKVRLVHVVRDPIATCWSIYKQNFGTSGNYYAHGMKDIAEYYKLYLDLMEFWKAQMPGRIFDLSYEALTRNQEEESRKLLKFCGLEWQEQCLEFYKNDRAVLTASAMQVRESMYQGSSESWRKYEKHLEPMIAALGSAIE